MLTPNPSSSCCKKYSWENKRVLKVFQRASISSITHEHSECCKTFHMHFMLSGIKPWTSTAVRTVILSQKGEIDKLGDGVVWSSLHECN